MARTLLTLLGVSQVAGYFLAARPAQPTRAAMPRMESPSEGSWPPPLDAVHIFKMTYGPDRKKTNLAMTNLATDKAAALLPLWKLQYAHEKGNMARNLLASVRPGATPGEETSMTFGWYLDGVDGDEHGVALVRFESEAKVMIIDAILISPSVNQHAWHELHSGINQSLVAIGEANGMSVRPWTDFDV